ncbi:ferrochelatase [Cryobacterium glaciale]|uniref:Coproporphyrin III ferrochelatase n=1 Tax=Cryobacterium glaciale TaxID=1259145 RepID=A0A4R8V1D8_9MICO|nr:ferrochelatase [Cryobacterium glaciale]TFB75174.1 ferrochelatase [Cryobacterium glaciale]
MAQYDAVLLAGFGGPEGQDDVIPFLRNVTGGRGIPEERLEVVAKHYRHYGGVSPINDQNRVLKAALQVELTRRGIDLPVIWGNRNWAPYIKDTISQAHADGQDRLLAIATSAYSSYSGCRQYREDFAAALADKDLTGTVHIDKIRQFFDHPGFVDPFITGVTQGLKDVALAIPGINVDTEVEILFSTHSIPMTDANKSGPAERGFGEGGAYAAQHRAVAQVIMDSLVEPDLDKLDPSESRVPLKTQWQLVYQSRSGPPSMPWLEPDINDAIALLPARGIRAVIIVPLGFVSDHMEVMWDLDNEAMETSEKFGIKAVRVPTPGVSPDFVSGLVDLIEERLNDTPASDRPAKTTLGPWYDVCRPGCCENVRLGFKPAVAGMAP